MFKQKVLITGGLGFIFSHVTQYLVQRGYEVWVIDNQSLGSHPEILDDTFFYIDANVEDSEERIVEIAPHYIIHAAAYSDVDRSIRDPKSIIKKNTDATLAVFEAARKIPHLKKLVYVSTDEVYGECDYPKKEHEILFPKNPYSFSKAHGSLLRIAYDNTYPELKNKTAETRFCNVFGERQDNRKILGMLHDNFFTKEPVPVHNGGTGYREYIYVENIPPAVERVMLHGNRVYNITNREGFTVQELIEEVEEMTGQKVETKKATRQGMDHKYQMNADRIYDELGWVPEINFKEGLKKYFYD